MSIERQYDIGLVAAMALKESRSSEHTGLSSRFIVVRSPAGHIVPGLILSEFGDRPLAEKLFKQTISPVEPSLTLYGGGTPLLEANRVGCDVQGFDINPMAAWIVREEIDT